VTRNSRKKNTTETEQTMSLTIQLKITLGETTRQISILKSTNLLDLQSTVTKLFALSPNAVVKFTYLDEDNDRISIGSSQELADAFAHTNALHLHAVAETSLFVTTENDENESEQIDDFEEEEEEQQQEEQEEEEQEEEEIDDSPLIQFFRDLGARLQGEGQSVAAQLKKAVDDLLQSGVVARDQLAQAYAALAASPKEMQDLVSKMIVILREQHDTIAALNGAGLSEARHAALCDRCRQSIVGVRYKCSACADYDLCAACFRHNIIDKQHPESHLFLTIVAPLRGSPAVFYQQRPWQRQALPPVRPFLHPPPPPPPAAPPAAPPMFNHLCGRLVSDETIPDGTKVKPGEEFTKIWRIENNGLFNWPEGVVVVSVGGQPLSDYGASEPMPALKIGESMSVAVDMRAPQEPGNYTSFWRLAMPNVGTHFGARLWVTIQVEPEVVEEVEVEEEEVEEEEAVAVEEKALEEFVAEPDVEEEAEPAPPVSEAPIGDSILNVIERSFEHIEQVVSQIVDPAPAAVEAVAPAEPAAPAAVAAEVVVAQEDESLWRSQRSQLKAMGFGQNDDQLKQLLKKHNGEVLKVVQELLEDD
jgi:hypothetical protein